MHFAWIVIHFNYLFELRGLVNMRTSTSTLFNKNIDYNRLARKIAIANLGEPVKRKLKWNERKGRKLF